MKKIFMIFLIVLIVLFSVSCSSENKYSSDKKESVLDSTEGENEELTKILDNITYDQILIEIDNIDVNSNSNDRARVTVHVPNYTQIFMAVLDETDIDQAIYDIIVNGEYTTLKYQKYATVTYDEKGQPVIDREEVAKEFVEKELIKAINAVTEAQKE